MRHARDLVALALVLTAAAVCCSPRPTAPPPPPPAVAQAPPPFLPVKPICQHDWKTAYGGPSSPMTCDISTLGRYCLKCGEGRDQIRRNFQAELRARANDPAWQRFHPQGQE